MSFELQIIKEEKLKEPETRKFLENAFRDGEIKTTGTDIDKLMPPVSRFGGRNRAVKKQGVIDKLKSFFEKFFGVGGPFTTEKPKFLITPMRWLNSLFLWLQKIPQLIGQRKMVSKWISLLKQS